MITIYDVYSFWKNIIIAVRKAFESQHSKFILIKNWFWRKRSWMYGIYFQTDNYEYRLQYSPFSSFFLPDLFITNLFSTGCLDVVLIFSIYKRQMQHHITYPYYTFPAPNIYNSVCICAFILFLLSMSYSFNWWISCYFLPFCHTSSCSWYVMLAHQNSKSKYLSTCLHLT